MKRVPESSTAHKVPPSTLAAVDARMFPELHHSSSTSDSLVSGGASPSSAMHFSVAPPHPDGGIVPQASEL